MGYYSVFSGMWKVLVQVWCLVCVGCAFRIPGMSLLAWQFYLTLYTYGGTLFSKGILSGFVSYGAVVNHGSLPILALSALAVGNPYHGGGSGTRSCDWSSCLFFFWRAFYFKTSYLTTLIKK